MKSGKVLFFLVILFSPLGHPQDKNKIKDQNLKYFDFQLNVIDPFFPGKELDNIKKSNKTSEIMSKEEKSSVYKFKIDHKKYYFPVFIQIVDKKVTDFFVPLPSYFMHNSFYQSLIDKFGIQDKFYHWNGNSLYQWDKNKDYTIVYSATCTITCFPIYLAGLPKESSSKKNDDSEYLPLINQMDK